MIDKNSITSVLSRILENELFRERDIYKTLLQYLIDASLKGTTPKEVTIAYDVFKKGKDFNSAEDTTVRVHMHKLRKILDAYYQDAGQSDEIRILIPKGHYKVRIVEKDKQKKATSSKNINKTTIALLILLCLSLGYIYFDKLYLERDNHYLEIISSDDPVWGHFFDNGYKTSVVIGDFFVFHEYHPQLNRPRRIQDYEINTKDELDTYIQNYPQNNPEEWFLGELPHNSLTNIIDIQSVFISFKKNLEINYTTNINIDFIKNKNIIYIGEFKNLRALADLISVLPVNYETLPWWHGKISFNSGDSIIKLQTAHDWGVSRYVVDLALVSKLPGQNNENYIIVAGFGYNSQIKAVELLSRKPSLISLEEKIEAIHGFVPDYFTLVLEVTGFDRASTNAEIKFFHEVHENYYQKYHYPTIKR